MVTVVDHSQEIAQFCLDRGLVDLVNFKSAEALSKASGRPLYSVLVANQTVDDNRTKSAVADYLDLPEAVLEIVLPKISNCMHAIPTNFAIENRIIPFEETEAGYKVAIAEPSALRSISSVRLITGKDISAFIVSPNEMERLIVALNEIAPKIPSPGIKVNVPGEKKRLEPAKPLTQPAAKTAAPSVRPGHEVNEAQDASQGKQIINFVNDLIMTAIREGASDIHIENYKDHAVARYRIDGVLEERKQIATTLFTNYPAVSTRIKIMASLDISERRLPQDGAITITMPEGRDVDLRVSVLPTVFGERIVMRILDREGVSFDLDRLGFPEKEYADIISALEASQGMVLVTGPTGSGKSTTLYGAIRRLNKPGVNILTAEDPVEFTIDGVGQVQIRDDIGLTFAAALRSFLRQDPEIILVGEIRDKDTADISIKAALTGHLVLSTLHANDAISTIVRLINMGMPGYLIGAALTLVVAQRLARKICPKCREPLEGDNKAILQHLGFTETMIARATLFHGAGCDYCNHTGYKGRQGIYEVLKITEEMRLAIISEDRASLKKIADSSGFRTMQMIGREMVISGLLTIEEYQSNLIFN